MRPEHAGQLARASAVLRMSGARAARASGRVTVLYDAFGEDPTLTKDWGFAALVEYGGRRVLFDTGNDADIFAHNASALGVELSTIDLVVISHRHGDHTSGLNHLVRVNPRVKIYVPREGFGVFGAVLPGTFYRQDASLPRRMRYFGGEPPAAIPSGTPWRGANFRWLDSLTEVAPGVCVIPTVSHTPGTLELRELTLALATPQGLALVVGCSHAGIETIVEAARAIAPRVHMIVGGLHLVTTPDPEITRVVAALHDHWRVDLVAPGHCTGEPAFAALQRAFGDRYVYAGVGVRIEL